MRLNQLKSTTRLLIDSPLRSFFPLIGYSVRVWLSEGSMRDDFNGPLTRKMVLTRSIKNMNRETSRVTVPSTLSGLEFHQRYLTLDAQSAYLRHYCRDPAEIGCLPR